MPMLETDRGIPHTPSDPTRDDIAAERREEYEAAVRSFNIASEQLVGSSVLADDEGQRDKPRWTSAWLHAVKAAAQATVLTQLALDCEMLRQRAAEAGVRL